MGLKYHVTDLIRVSEVRSKKRCLCCGEELDHVGIIIYGFGVLQNYSWVHYECVKNLLPAKFTSYLKDLKNVKRTKGQACSFCGGGRSRPIIDFGHFSLHEKCIPQLVNKVEKVFEENRSKIFSRML